LKRELLEMNNLANEQHVGAMQLVDLWISA